MRLRVTLPATVANIGPGFDSLALAVEIRNEFVLDTEGTPRVTVEGEGAGELPGDETNLVVRAMFGLAEDVRKELPTFELACRNEIPLGRGLGSSASAVVGGLALANALLGMDVGDRRLLQMAAEIEGHADNVAACLLGGLTIAYPTDDGWRAARLSGLAAGVEPVVFVPDSIRMDTVQARRVIPSEVPVRDAVWNAAHAALTVHALTADPALLSEALNDRLHQPHRLPMMPATRELFDRLREATVPVCLAGSGPSLLAFERGDHPIADAGPGWCVVRPAVAEVGLQVLEG
jgi:homoserine kinase